MTYLFDQFNQFVFKYSQYTDIYLLFNNFLKTLNGKELEFAEENFPLFLMSGKAAIHAEPEIQKFLAAP